MHIKPWLALAALLFAVSAEAAASAGSVTLLTGRGTASSADGTIRALAKGADVFAGEVINTGPNSYANLRFRDGSFILLRPNSRFQIEQYEYRGETATASTKPTPAAQPKPAAATTSAATESGDQDVGRAFFRLLKGGFRAVTGLVGKVDRNAYRVATPVATIGIRGTDYVVVLCDLACNADPVIANNLPAGSAPAGGVVVGVITGGVFVANNAGGSVDVGQDQYLVTLPDGTQVELPAQPRFLRVDPIPNPESCE